jgi:prepilin-type N-terminal cleavage/methylation domain-containing protein
MNTYRRSASPERGFTLIELLVVIAVIGILSGVVLASLNPSRAKSRDAYRLSEIRQIQYALNLYFNTNGKYPTCLYPGGSCTTTLQGSPFMSTVPKDPLTNLGFTYAARGSGTNCTGFHLGASLEDKTNPAMVTGADAPAATVCTGSAVDFSGLSFAAGGQLCNATAGTPQPTAAANGETCYDVVN